VVPYPLQPTAVSHNLAPLQPPLEGGEENKTSALLPELNRHTVLDGDLDISVDLGEAVAGATAVTSQLTSRSTSPVLLPYYPSPVRDEVPAPVLGAQPGELGSLHSCRRAERSYVQLMPPTKHGRLQRLRLRCAKP